MSGALERSFLEDIAANIDDDTPRLVYADWLTENNRDDRAEFIRVQIERARLPAWDAAQVRLRLREAELLKQHGEAWLAELPAIEGAKWEGFRRGIVAEVSFASFEAMRASAHLCREVAPVEAVTVRWPRQAEADEDTPIAELRELNLTGRPGNDNEIAWLANSPQLSTLRVLTARGLWVEGLGRLVASPHLADLKALRLPENNLGNAGIRALTEAASLTGLVELDLSGRSRAERYSDDPVVRAAGMAALANWSGLAGVRSLKLSGNEVGREGLRSLLRSPNARALKELVLRNCRLDGPALAELSSARPELRLEMLNLGENILKDGGVEFIAAARCLLDLKSLRLDRCELRLTSGRLLAKATFMDGLRILNVEHNALGTAGLTALLEREPPSLHTLRMRDNSLFDRGAVLLAGSPRSNGLLEVDLSQNGLGNEAAKALGQSAHLQKLLILRLLDHTISEKAAATLASSPLGSRLALLELVYPPEQGDIPF
jgi:uncharacterized protein (TIGR02996 family)